jgi:hypothetical protein
MSKKWSDSQRWSGVCSCRPLVNQPEGSIKRHHIAPNTPRLSLTLLSYNVRTTEREPLKTLQNPVVSRVRRPWNRAV